MATVATAMVTATAMGTAMATARSKVKKTEILMIPRSEDEPEEPRGGRGVRSLILGEGEGGLIVRRLVVVVVALLLATQVVRNAAVGALATLHPESAAKLWAGHPAVEISLGLAEIGRASRTRTPIDPATFAMIDDAAVKSPLSPDPFLVRGVQLRNEGDAAGCEAGFSGRAAARSALAAGGLFPRRPLFSRGRFPERPSANGASCAAFAGRDRGGGAVRRRVRPRARALARDARDVPLATDHGGGRPDGVGAGPAQCGRPARAGGPRVIASPTARGSQRS